jgi:tetratricopeptide (TPR) repeat protein
LGRGGFGEVWKASAPGGAEAALKIIQLGGTEGRKEFRALQLVKKVRHSHLVPIFAFWLKNGEGQIIDDALIGTAETFAVETKPADFRATMAAPPVMVRPLATELIIAMGLGDKSLYDRLQERLAEGHEGIPQEELLHYMDGAAEAIDFLNRPVHNLGSGPVAIQHCDIKPHNLMIVGGGVQVCDFGLARMMGADRTTTAAATLAYAAPECLVEGRPSATTDQYSLAVSYYELKTGVLPYRDETLAAVMDAKRQGQLDFSKVSSSEQAVLRRATSENPPDRFPSCLEMVTALKRAAVAVPVTQTFTPPRKTAKRGKLPMVFAALILLGAIAGGYAIMNRDRFFKSPNAEDTGPATHSKTSDIAVTPPIVEPIQNPNVSNSTDEQSAVNKKPATTNVTENPTAKAAALLKSARSHIDAKAWDPALRECGEAIALDPSLAEAYLLRGRCYLNLEPVSFDKAIADFEKSRSLDRDRQFHAPADFAAAYLGRGTALLTAKHYDEAIADFSQAAKFTPQDYRIFSRLGAAWLAQEQWQNAVDALTRSVEINPNDETDFVNRGRAYRKLGQPQKAVEDFLVAAALDPQNATAQLQIGSAYIDLKQPIKAIDPFGKAIDVYANSPESKDLLAQAHFDRATAYLELVDAGPENAKEVETNYRKAIEDLTQAARLLSVEDIASLVLAHRLRQSCYEELKQTANAETEKEIAAALRVLEKDPGHADAMNTVAYYLATSADTDIRDTRQAIAFAARACEISKEQNPDFLDTLATAYAADGNFEEAAKWETRAIELFTDATKKDKARVELEKYRRGQK